ncbi:hypothetical protein Slala05_75560 [Streptomyces lavendulae subsp. lavendulae]|nr:hypothetical protein Slala05_75560 [Streptomyces lavendulae subsp. lavendulae]
MLRFSVAPKGGRHPGVPADVPVVPLVLQSSVVLKGNRQARATELYDEQEAGCDPRSSRRTTATGPVETEERGDSDVAILGRPEGRPPPDRLPDAPGEPRAVAILGRPKGRPPPLARIPVQVLVGELRSSVAPKGDRHGS